MTDNYKAQSRVMIEYGKKLDDIAANAAASSRTVTLNVGEVSKVAVFLSFTQSAASFVSLTAESSPDEGTTYMKLPSIAISAGTGTLTDFTWKKATSASETFYIEVNTEALTLLKLIFDTTGGGASDKFNVWVNGALGA